MAYTPPELTELLASLKFLKQKSGIEYGTRPKIIAMLEDVSRLINTQSSINGANQSELRANLVGTCLYLLDKIEQEFYIHSPAYKSGRIYNSGSQLYTYLLEVIKANSQNPVTAREKMIYINKFYQFIKKNPSLKSDPLLVDLRSVLTRQLTILTNPIADVINAVPTEPAVTKHMSTLPEDYRNAKEYANKKAWLFKSKPNPKRIFLTQLMKAVANIRSKDEGNSLERNELTRSQCTKMGALLYVERSIAKEYYFRSPRNSELYRECRTILNAPDEYNLDEKQQLACLTAFQNFIDNYDYRDAIKKNGKHYFPDNNLLVDIDAPLNAISASIKKMQDELTLSISKNWPMTTAFATAGAVVGAWPGYGAGTVIGLFLSEGRTVRPVNEALGSGLGSVATAFFGRTSSAGFYSYMISDFFVSSTLSRAFAQIFELAGIAIGGAAGAIIGCTFDLTYKAFKELCVNYLDFYERHPELRRNADCELVECLLELPPEIFTPDLKNQIRYTAEADEPQSSATLAV